MTEHGDLWRRDYDSIVVGGGTAGAVVAARLSEDDSRQVLLVEAGAAAFSEETLPPEIATAGFPVLRGYNWNFAATLRGDGAASFPYPMARVLGGGSAINGSVAMPPRREDFEAWAALGNRSWSWHEVHAWLPELQKIAHRGIRAQQHDAATSPGALQHAFFQACADRKLPAIDVAISGGVGVGAVPQNVCSGRRLSTATLYLREARHRKNLTVVGRCEVERLLMKQGAQHERASGVEVLIDGARRALSGAQIVLCAGAIGSPTILLRSGIGPEQTLERSAVRVALDLPGVGCNLIDHPVVSLWALPAPGVRCSHVHQAILQLSSSGLRDSYDLQLFLLADVSTADLPGLADLTGADSLTGISVMLATPYSSGRVALQSANGRCMPRIDLNCFDREEDVQRTRHGVRMAWEIMHDPHFGGLMGRPVSCSSRVIRSDSMLDRMLKTTVRASWHPVGTLRMGGPDDPMAVVSEYGKLRGCDNVYVADASVMPTIPRVPTNLTCMLIGERIAAHLRNR